MRFHVQFERDLPVGEGAAIQSMILSMFGPIIYGNPRWEQINVSFNRVSVFLYSLAFDAYINFAAMEAQDREGELAKLKEMGCRVTPVTEVKLP